MKCPACGEINEAGMQFCIFCGQTLAAPTGLPSPVSVPGLPTVEEIQAMSRPLGSTSQMMVLLCTVCNKTDPINGQFCCFCGGRTMAAPMPYQAPVAVPNFGPTVSQQNIPAAVLPNMIASQEIMLGEEFSRSTLPPAPQRSKSGGGGGLGIFGVLLATILGAAAGFGGVYYMKSTLQELALESSWPPEGVLIFSTVKDGELKIGEKNKMSFVLGSLSSNGLIQLPTFDPGEYELTLKDKTGKELQKPVEFTKKPGAPNIIGFPKRLGLN